MQRGASTSGHAQPTAAACRSVGRSDVGGAVAHGAVVRVADVEEHEGGGAVRFLLDDDLGLQRRGEERRRGVMGFLLGDEEEAGVLLLVPCSLARTHIVAPHGERGVLAHERTIRR